MTEKHDNLCIHCGAPLPVGSTFMVCDRCYRETRRRRG